MKVMTTTILTILAALNFSCAGTTDKSGSDLSSAEKQETEMNTMQAEVSTDLSIAEKDMEVEVKAAVQDKVVTEKKEDTREWPIEKQMKAKSSDEKKEATLEKKPSSSQEELSTVKEESMKNDVKQKDNPTEMGKPDHSAFNAILSSHVSNKGAVNYDGIKGDISKLNAYLKDLESNPVSADWSKNEKLAYWINAYNAYTIKLILDNYPVNSIQDIAGGKPWDKKFIKIDGKTYSLNNIENDIIRPDFNEPRIHFAVNCAAQSCPPLANKAFTADNMNSLLSKQTKAFLANSKYNTIEKDAVKISKIFDWYGKDFSNLISFLNKYTDTEISSGAKVTYTEYDWGLNSK